MTDQSQRAEAMFRQSDILHEKARRMRVEADALERAAGRFFEMAAAIADGREDDFTNIAAGWKR